MAREAIGGVPADQVGQVVQDFVDDGVENIAVEKQDDGAFVVIPREDDVAKRQAGPGTS